MRIEIKYSKISNLYSFISNLSCWNDDVCVPQRKKEWLKKTGELNNQEKKSLKKFTKIFQSAQSNIELIFLLEEGKKIWNKLSKKIGKKKSNELKSIFLHLMYRFNKIWDTENKNLYNIKIKFLQNKKTLESYLKTINRLCGLTTKQLPKKISIRLLLSASKIKECQGWAFKNDILLECSGWPIKKINYLTTNIFLHEYFHIALKKNKKIFNQLKMLINRNKNYLDKSGLFIWPAEIIFEEAIISSFLPEGFLAEKILNTKIKQVARNKLKNGEKDQLSKLRYFCALNLYNLAKNYIEANKSVDKKYLLQIEAQIKNFIKSKKGRRISSAPKLSRTL